MSERYNSHILVMEDRGTNGSPESTGTAMSPHGSTVSFHNIHYKVTQRSGCLCIKRKTTTKDILIDLKFSGLMKPRLKSLLCKGCGCVVCSFLDVLAARKDPAGLSGEVLIDGAPQPPNFKCLSGYVVQDDVVMGTLTVRENFRFSAALRLPSSVSQEEKEGKVNRLITELADILLDCHLSRYSTLIIIIFLFVYLSALAPNSGYTCEPHNNPADFFLDVINGDSTAIAFDRIKEADDSDPDRVTSSRQNIEDHLVQEYRGSQYYGETKAQLEQITMNREYSVKTPSRTITYNTSFSTQFRWVLKRTFTNLILNPQTSFAQIGVTVFLALIVGAIFFGVKNDQSGLQNRMGALFFITTNQCFSSVSSAELFITERKLFIHEYISGYYRVSVYFLCKLLSDIITLRTLPAIFFSCVAYFMIGFKATVEAFFLFMLTVALVAYTATAMTMAISADQSVVAIANIFMTIAFVFMMIFSGLLVNLPSIVDWLAWFQYLSIPRYGLTALQINEFVGLQLCGDIPLNGTLPPGMTCTGEDFLKNQGIDYTTWGLWQNHVALAIMTIIFLAIAYLKLRFTKKFT
uniref:ATP-binding cassette, sub-family G (WHITE), member 2a n=1 Tax=Hucho hucho TaxID=62062 RepID=A0A4W5QYL9_9TELE